MSVFFIRVWVDGDSIVAVRTGESLITETGDYGNATFIDAVAEGAYVDAGTLRPTLTYANNVLSSSLVTLLPAKDVTALLAQSGYAGQAVYNWADGNQYQWNGAAWGSTPLTSLAVASIADQSFTENIATAIIPYDNFSQGVKDLFDSIAADLGQLTDDTVALEADVTTLQTDYTTLNGTVTANVTAISGLETRVTSAEGAITASASDITQLQSDLTTAEGSISGNATAISGLDVRVTDNEGDISSQASAITSLSTTVGNNTTSITQAQTSINGIEGKYGVTIDSNGSVTGFQLLSGVGGSAFNVRADQFAVFNSSGGGGDNPFTIFTSSRTIDGVTYPAGTYIEDAFIDNAAIVNASVGTLKIAENAVTVPQSQNLSSTITGNGGLISINSFNYTLPTAGTILVLFNCSQEFPTGARDWRFDLYIGPTIVASRGGGNANSVPTINYSSGTYAAGTYAITVLWYGEDSGVKITQRALSVLGAMR